MNNIEDFLINIDKSRCNQEGWWSVQLKPLLLLKHSDLIFWWYLLVHILWILFIELLAHFVSHFLKFYFNLLSFLLDHFFEFFVVVGLLSEPDAPERISLEFEKLEPQFHVHSNVPQVVNDYLLNIQVLESIWIVDQLRFIFYSLLIWFELLSSTTIASWAHIVYSLWSNSTRNEAIYEGDRMRGSSINRDVLGFFLSFQQTDVFWIFRKVLVQVRVINWVNPLDKALVFVVGWVHKSARYEAEILK